MGIAKYWYVLFFVIGFVTNILSLLVMTMKHNRKLSTCVYMGVIAVNDNVYLLLAFHYWFANFIESSHYTTWVCKFKAYSVLVTGTFGGYEIFFMTLDKCIAITMPHKSTSLCTTKRAKIVSVVNLITCIIFYLPILPWTSLVGLQCQP